MFEVHYKHITINHFYRYSSHSFNQFKKLTNPSKSFSLISIFIPFQCENSAARRPQPHSKWIHSLSEALSSHRLITFRNELLLPHSPQSTTVGCLFDNLFWTVIAFSLLLLLIQSCLLCFSIRQILQILPMIQFLLIWR